MMEFNEPNFLSILNNLEGWRNGKAATIDTIQDAIAEKVYRQFAHGEGKEVLEIILEMTLRRPIRNFDPIALSYFEGQNAIAIALMSYFKRGKEIQDERGTKYANSSDRNTSGSDNYTDSSTGFAPIR